VKIGAAPRRAALAVLAALALLISALPVNARQEPSAGIQIRQANGALTVSNPAFGMTVLLSGSPLRIGVLGAGGRGLIAAKASSGSLTFALDRVMVARSLSRQISRVHDEGPLVVHVLRLIRWNALADGVSLLAATDDPLSRAAKITVHIAARGTVEIAVQLTDTHAVVSANLAVPSGLDEHFFGLGEQFGGVDRRGHIVNVRVQDGMTTIRPLGGYAPAPFFVSTRGYGFYLAGTRPSRFVLDANPNTTAWNVTYDAAALYAYVLDGPRPADVLARYADLTGHPPMPPSWTLGIWKTALGGQARVLAEAQRLRRQHIPVSVIWTYDAVDEDVKLGWPYPNFARIPPGPYPNLPAFTAALHREGFQALGYLAPEFTRSRPGFAYPAQHGYFVQATSGHIYLLDLTNPSALAWWKSDERYILTNLGFDGWLLDLGDRLPPGAQFFNGLGADDMANQYPLLLARTAADVARSVKPSALFVMRSSFSGVQSLQSAVWPGDQRANWSTTQGLPAAISAGLSWGISGAPFWGSDIGGYLDGGLPESQQEELWTRWLEFGALSPIMRDQLGNMGFGAIYLWSNKRTVAVFRSYAQLHQALFPYLDAAARTAHLTGLPIMRDLFLAYPHDPNVYRLNDEYLLGPDLLVAPVITAGATSRLVYLPAGTWFDYWTGARLAGGRTVRVVAPLDRIPLLVRGGALIPWLTDTADTLAPATDPKVRRVDSAIRLQLYTGGPGENVTLADGSRLTYQDAGRHIDVSIDGPARRYIVAMTLPVAPALVCWDGAVLPRLARPGAGGWSFSKGGVLSVRVRAAAGSHALSVVNGTR
jgi:alpha-D-xyloside xylohydrolase